MRAQIPRIAECNVLSACGYAGSRRGGNLVERASFTKRSYTVITDEINA